MRKLLAIEIMPFFMRFHGVPIYVQCSKLGTFTVLTIEIKTIVLPQLTPSLFYVNFIQNKFLYSRGKMIQFWHISFNFLILFFFQEYFNNFAVNSVTSQNSFHKIKSCYCESVLMVSLQLFQYGGKSSKRNVRKIIRGYTKN